MDPAAKPSGVPFSQAKEDETGMFQETNCVVGLGKLPDLPGVYLREIRLLRRICGLASKRLNDNKLIKDDYYPILRAETLGSLVRTSWTV